MVTELLTQKRIPVSAIYGLERWAGQNAALLQPFLQIFNPVEEADLKKISTLTTPAPVMAVAEMPDGHLSPGLTADNYCFYLDGIQDPGNLGTILRIADWFGLPAVICSPDSADAFSPKAVQASMGAIFRVQTAEIPLEEWLCQTPGTPVAGAVLDGDNLFETELPERGLIVVGNEGRGISAEAEGLLTHRLTIPRDPSGGAESLNAAVSAGILAATFRGMHRPAG